MYNSIHQTLIRYGMSSPSSLTSQNDEIQQINTTKPKEVVYFEVTIIRANSSAVGFTDRGIVYEGKVSKSCVKMSMVGCDDDSVGYHGECS
jgi:hypothetical protein